MLFLISLSLCGSTVFAAETITVAVASSLYPAMQQQVQLFEQQHDVVVRLVPGSTGRLYNQITQGAPFDVFIAADDERPALLTKQGKAVKQYDVGMGYLGLMAGDRSLTGFEQLKSPLVRHIAIANPDVAPFGKVARQVLQSQGLWQVLKPKFVYTQSAMQAAMMVNKGLVDAGFVPVSPEGTFMATIPYTAVLLTDNRVARVFLKGMEQAKSVEKSECCLPKQRGQAAPEGVVILSHGGAASAAQNAAQSAALELSSVRTIEFVMAR